MDRTTVAPVSREFAAHGFRVEGKSDIGRGGRDENQDFMNAFVAGDAVLAVVADGMGGHSGGFEASRIAVQAMGDVFTQGGGADPATLLGQGILAAHQKINLVVANRPELKGMGTTVVAAVFQRGKAWIAHVGDSRCYLIRGRSAILLTLDHSRVNRMVVSKMIRPEDAQNHAMASVLERSVGASATCEPEVTPSPISLQAGDRLLLCSDGLWSAVDDGVLGALGSGPGLEESAEALKAQALANTTDDNTTVLLLQSLLDLPGDRVEDVRVAVGLLPRTDTTPRAAAPPPPVPRADAPPPARIAVQPAPPVGPASTLPKVLGTVLPIVLAFLIGAMTMVWLWGGKDDGKDTHPPAAPPLVPVGGMDPGPTEPGRGEGTAGSEKAETPSKADGRPSAPAANTKPPAGTPLATEQPGAAAPSPAVEPTPPPTTTEAPATSPAPAVPPPATQTAPAAPATTATPATLPAPPAQAPKPATDPKKKKAKP